MCICYHVAVDKCEALWLIARTSAENHDGCGGAFSPITAVRSSGKDSPGPGSSGRKGFDASNLGTALMPFDLLGVSIGLFAREVFTAINDIVEDAEAKTDAFA